MSDDAQKLRLRPRVGASNPVLALDSIESSPPHRGANDSSRSMQSDAAGTPLRLQPDLAASDGAVLARQVIVPVTARPRHSPAVLNLPPMAAPLPPVTHGAQRAGLVLGISVVIILVGAGFLAYRLFVSSSQGTGSLNVLTMLTPAARPSGPTLNRSASEVAGLPRYPDNPAPPSTATDKPKLASDSLARTVTEGAPNAFRTWVENVKISGVRVSSNPRILIGKFSFNQGDVVDKKLGIVFVGYDRERYLVRFQDSSGAVLERLDRVLVPINAPPTATPRQPKL